MSDDLPHEAVLPGADEIDDRIERPDATRRYYRRSKVRRRDLAAAMVDGLNPAGGLIQL